MIIDSHIFLFQFIIYETDGTVFNLYIQQVQYKEFLCKQTHNSFLFDFVAIKSRKFKQNL